MLENEVTRLVIKRHPLIYLAGLVRLFIAVVFYLLSQNANSAQPFWDNWAVIEWYRDIVSEYFGAGFGIPALWVSLAILAVAVWFFIKAVSRLLHPLTLRDEVTNYRLTSRSGLLFQRKQELYLRSIDGVLLEQSLIGKLMNTGTLKVIGRGDSSITLVYILHYDETKDAFDHLLLKEPSL
jgi:uncharacterized membrane protein YdbT with pleckstrin-like domain